MNDLLIQSQEIAEKIGKQIPKPAYKAAYLACKNQCLSQTENNVAIQQYKECCNQIANAIELSYDIGVVIAPIAEQIQEMIKSMVLNIQCAVQSMPMLNLEFVNLQKIIYNRLLFYRIAEEIGFPIYLECGTELQAQLIESYRENNNNCNVDEMQKIIMDYYNEDYINSICNGFINENIFSKERIELLVEGIKTYQYGFYGAANSLFAVQMSGMIRDIYNELSGIYKYTRKEKNEIKSVFNLQFCKDDSEKVMLMEILCKQDNGIILWYKVAQYFLKFVYSTGEKYTERYPKRHMICHGIQTNYATKEMCLKLIICLDILAELAWRINKIMEKSE